MQPITYKTPELRIDVRQDDHNWIIVYGPKTLKSFEKHAERWYFMKLESMLQRLSILLRDRGVKTLDLDGIRQVNAMATSHITLIAKKLEGLLASSTLEDNSHAKY
jgi:hypothetical protein